MKLLVTGAGGFVGRELCKTLSNHQHYIRGVFRRPTGNIEHIQDIIAKDINDGTDWQGSLDDIDTVIHLAARAHILTDSVVNPLEEFRKFNTLSTLKLAVSAANAGVRRFVFVSSIGVNGASSIYPFTEQSITNPIEPYALSKLEAEHGLQNISERTGMELVIVRPPLVYGIDCPGNFLRLLKLVYKGIPLPLGAVNNCRSLIEVSNLVEFLVSCAEHPAAANQIFLIADNPDISTPDLIRNLAKGMNVKERLFPVPNYVLTTFAKMTGYYSILDKLCGNLQIDCSYARKTLGWSQCVSLDDGLFKVGNWYKDIRNSNEKSL